MAQFAQAAGQSAADFTQALGLGELAEKHGYEMIPATETFGTPFGLVAKDQVEKLSTVKQSNQLTEQT